MLYTADQSLRARFLVHENQVLAQAQAIIKIFKAMTQFSKHMSQHKAHIHITSKSPFPAANVLTLHEPWLLNLHTEIHQQWTVDIKEYKFFWAATHY